MTRQHTSAERHGADDALERAIEASYRLALSTGKREDWQAMAQLVKRRSPDQVKRMEIERGLF